MGTAGHALLADTARLFGTVRFAGNAVVEDYCIIGCGPEENETQIGSDAVIRAGTVIYAGARIGQRFQTGNKVNIREFSVIGDDVSVGTHSVVEHHVTLGDGVRIHSQAFIPEYTTVEAKVWIGPNVVLTNATYPANRNTKANLTAPRLLESSVIGANSTILPGITIGRGALVGAGSVVTRDVPDGMVAFGNPARIHRARNEIADYAE